MTSHDNSDDSGQSVTCSSHAVVLANLQAGRGKPAELLSDIDEVFRQFGFSAQIQTTSSLDDLEVNAAQAIKDGARLLFAVGGDGTLQGLANAAFGRDVVIGVVPAGGGNDFARAIGLPKDPIQALRAALRGAPRTVDLAKASFEDGRQRFFLGGGGIGLDADAAKFSSFTFQNWPGRTRYIASAVCAYFSYRPRRVRVTIDSKAMISTWQKSVLACTLNSPTFGAGIRLAPAAHVDDGKLDFAFLEELSFRRLLLTLPQLALRGTLNLPGLRTEQFVKIRLETESPAYFQGDGELLGSTPVEIEVVPNAAKFLAPKSELS